MGLLDFYQSCLLIHPLPTQAVTVANVWALGDVIQQLREDRRGGIQFSRTWKMFFTGLGGGSIWACYHQVAAEYIPRIPVSGPIERTAIYLAVEKLVACPLVLGGYQIPAAVLTNGGTIREVPTAVREKLKELIIANYKFWTVPAIAIYQIPVQYRVVTGSLLVLAWSTYCSAFATRCAPAQLSNASALAGGGDGSVLVEGAASSPGCEPEALAPETLDCLLGAKLWRSDLSSSVEMNSSVWAAASLADVSFPLLAPLRCEEEEEEESDARRLDERHLKLQMSDAADTLWELWRRRFDCWWLDLPAPTRAQLVSCLGGVGLHAGGRGSSRAPTSPTSRCHLFGNENAPEAFRLPTLPEFPALPQAAARILPWRPPPWQGLRQLQIFLWMRGGGVVPETRLNEGERRRGRGELAAGGGHHRASLEASLGASLGAVALGAGARAERVRGIESSNAESDEARRVVTGTQHATRWAVAFGGVLGAAAAAAALAARTCQGQGRRRCHM